MSDYDKLKADYLKLAEAHRLAVASETDRVHVQYMANKLEDDEREDYIKEIAALREEAAWWKQRAIELGYTGEIR